MSAEAFWSARARRYGHTGWSDAAVYAYDQRLRAAALLQLLQDGPALDGLPVLDYGCGSGDFAALLAARGAEVQAYDLSPDVLALAARRHALPRLRFEPDLASVLQPARRYGLVLSITVLQHVVDDGELAILLWRLGAAMQPGGRLLVLETFAAQAPSASSYLKRRSVADLVAACAAAGLRLQQQRGFYHPSESPTAAFSAYRHSLPVRLLARAADFRLPGAVPLLQRLAARAVARDRDDLDHAASPSQWLVFVKGAA